MPYEHARVRCPSKAGGKNLALGRASWCSRFALRARLLKTNTTNKNSGLLTLEFFRRQAQHRVAEGLTSRLTPAVHCKEDHTGPILTMRADCFDKPTCVVFEHLVRK